MAFSLGLLLPAFEGDRVCESIHPADNLFRDLVGASNSASPESNATRGHGTLERRNRFEVGVAHIDLPLQARCQTGSIL
jgi:hypothetical protein